MTRSRFPAAPIQSAGPVARRVRSEEFDRAQEDPRVAEEDRGRTARLPAAEDVPGPVYANSRNKDQQRLNRQFDRLNDHLPRVVGQRIAWLRKPSSRWVRLPIGILLIIASVFSFLPVLGLWMLPLGLMLLAVDVPFQSVQRDWRWFGSNVNGQE
jgi:hypothetical protein